MPVHTDRYMQTFLYKFLHSTNFKQGQVIATNASYLLNLEAHTVRSFRQIFNKPSKNQRTWSNASTAKKINQTNIFQLKNKNQQKLHAEYINLFYFVFFKHEWSEAARKFKQLPVFFKNKKIISLNEITNYQIASFYNNPFIKKKNQTTKTFTTGFRFLFTIKYKNNISVWFY